MIRASVPSLVTSLLSLEICSVDAMSRASILEVHIGALESTLSSHITGIAKLESKLAFDNSELDGAAAELESTEFYLRFKENAARLMPEQVQIQGPQLRRSKWRVLLPKWSEGLRSPTFGRLVRQSPLH